MDRQLIKERMDRLDSKQRYNSKDYISKLFPDFIELHGDRVFGDDNTVIGGIATIENTSVTIIGQNRGKTLKEKVEYNFSMCHPEGYRKSLRLMKQAEKFRRPIICFVDTLGAYPGVEAEERGQSSAIANNLMEMQRLMVPIISIIIGSGGSGGALAFLVENEVAILENSLFSIISPQGCANILWKSPSRKLDAACLLKITSEEIMQLNLVDYIIPEPMKGETIDYDKVSENIRSYITRTLKKYRNQKPQKVAEKRYKKYRLIGRKLV
ncbi:acetyl-CoA carboxylase carboxyl transferase subunit alpha [Enterocloster clostridioformis]|uniref:acetyl-CoA carboxylase carboxyl transferase subunit alpha n=1 Tax=Enterocloster clostridioformis TaxID=1531 RepID=UPI00267755FE|nr:acetyl-CoA carboxylase carboxyl transferase subunit alpha [Enterocloster clostridioformis]